MTAPTLSLALAHVQLSTGLRVHYAEQGDAANPPLVLLHGLSDSWFSFSRVLPALADHYHVYALDQRGHGDSDRPASAYTMPELAADVVAFLDAMGLPTALLAGHSMGSIVASYVALLAPERLTGLILIGANTRWDGRELVELKTVFDTLEDPVAAEFVREFQASTALDPLPEPFLERVVAESLKLPSRVWRAAMDGVLATDFAGRLGTITTPALVIGGEQDGLCQAAHQRALADALPNAELRLYPEVAHSPHWERPETFVSDVVAFLNRITSR